MDLTSAHDAFIGKALDRIETAQDFLTKNLPVDIRDNLDFRTLEIVKDSFISTKLRKYFSDKLFKINYKEKGWAYLYVLFEHKSHPDKFVAFQTLKYRIRIWERLMDENEARIKRARKIRKNGGDAPPVPRLDKLPLIIPLVFYHGAEKWNVALDFKSLIDENRPAGTDHFIPDFKYLLCDLSKIDDDELIGTVHYQVAMLIMKYIYSDDIKEKFPEILKLLRKLDDSRTILEFLETILEYVTKGTKKITGKEIEYALKGAVPEFKGGEIMQTLAEKWFSEGKEKGKEEGKKEGRKEGRKDGEKDGEKRGIIKTAANMLKANLDMDLIREVTGLPEQELRKLATQ